MILISWYLDMFYYDDRFLGTARLTGEKGGKA